MHRMNNKKVLVVKLIRDTFNKAACENESEGMPDDPYNTDGEESYEPSYESNSESNLSEESEITQVKRRKRKCRKRLVLGNDRSQKENRKIKSAAEKKMYTYETAKSYPESEMNNDVHLIKKDPYHANGAESYYEPSYESSSESNLSEESEITQVNRRKRKCLVFGNDQSQKGNMTVKSAAEKKMYTYVTAKSYPESEINKDIHLIKKGNDTVKNIKHYKTKKHACLYCRSLCTKLARHLERKHRDEQLVKKALKASKGSVERKQLWCSIQKQGDFAYYKNQKDNEPVIIPLRRKEGKPPSELNCRSCPYCQGFFSKRNLKNHVREFCDPKKTNQKRSIEISSRQLMLRVKDEANELVRKHIFPRLRMDAILKMVLNDDLAIAFANWATTKFRYSDHNYKMIRAQVKQIGNILLNVNAKNPKVTSLVQLLTPQSYEDFVEAVKIIAGFDPDTNTYRSPSIALSSCTIIGKVADVAMTIAIREADCDMENNITKFKQLLATLKSGSLTKTAVNNMVQNQRQKVIKMPSTSDIRKLGTYINKEIVHTYEKLKQTVDETIWRHLNELILVHLLVFNRKRPGEIEITFVLDFNSLTTPTEDELSSIEPVKRIIASSYSRFLIRGKLNRPVPVLIDSYLIPIIKFLISTRTTVNISAENKYLFAKPTRSGNCEYLNAAKALKRFTVAAGLGINCNITATTLRKHLASKVSSIDTSEKTVSTVADFMGHAVDIHKNIYRQVPVISDIMKVAPFLEEAGGVMSNVPINGEEISKDSEDRSVARSEFYTENIGHSFEVPAVGGISQEGPKRFSVHQEKTNCNDDCEIQTCATINNSETDSQIVSQNVTLAKQQKYDDPQLSSSRNATAIFNFNEAQIALLERELSEFLKVGEIPSLDHCRKLRLRYGLLHNDITTPLHIQHWMSNRIQAGQTYYSTPKKSKLTKLWTPHQEAAIKKHFQKYIRHRQYPSSDYIREVCMTVPCLENRTPRKVKSHLQFLMKK